MITLTSNNQVYTVMDRIQTTPKHHSEILNLALKAIPMFKLQHGFISVSLHSSHDKTLIITYLQWECEADHWACLKNREWWNIPELAGWAELDSRKATRETQTFEVIACAEVNNSHYE